MTGDDDLRDFVVILRQRLTTLPRVSEGHAPETQEIVDTLGELGVLDLAPETTEFDDPLTWLSSTVRTCAHHSPAVAFALAARYVAQRAAPTHAGATASIAVGYGGLWRATVPTLFAPEHLVLLDRVARTGTVAPWTAVSEEPDQGRIGLAAARLRSVAGREGDEVGSPLTTEAAQAAIFELDVLNASVGMGLLEQALAASEEYAINRRQFGQPVASFPGLAAILVDMRLRMSAVSGLLASALGGNRDAAELAAVTGRACVDSCIDAIQVHGGYGYIDEFPVAGLLRDAVSLRARGGGRRSATAAVAASHLAFVSASATASGMP